MVSGSACCSAKNDNDVLYLEAAFLLPTPACPTLRIHRTIFPIQLNECDPYQENPPRTMTSINLMYQLPPSFPHPIQHPSSPFSQTPIPPMIQKRHHLSRHHLSSVSQSRTPLTHCHYLLTYRYTNVLLHLQVHCPLGHAHELPQLQEHPGAGWIERRLI